MTRDLTNDQEFLCFLACICGRPTAAESVKYAIQIIEEVKRVRPDLPERDPIL
jgi:hypothetical protein